MTAFQNFSLGPISLTASTGLRRYRAVTLSTATGYLTAPSSSTVGQPIIGVLQETSTGSTENHPRSFLPIGPVAKMEGETGISAGMLVSASTVGRVQSSTNAGDSVIGMCLSGSTGAANTVYPILLFPLGSSVAAA